MDKFLCYCASTLKLGYSTVKLYLAAVKHHLILSGHMDITATMPRLRITLRGIQRYQPPSGRKRIPLSAAHMNKLAQTLQASPAHDDRLLWAAVCLGYFAGLRAGEFCCKSAGGFNPDINLCHDDIILGFECKINKRFVKVHLKHSKCDRLMQGVDITLFETGRHACPYQAIMNYFQVEVNQRATSTLFVLSNGKACIGVLLHILLLGPACPATVLAATPYVRILPRLVRRRGFQTI